MAAVTSCENAQLASGMLLLKAELLCIIALNQIAVGTGIDELRASGLLLERL